MENNTEKNIITGMNDESHKIKQEAPDSPCSKNQSYNNNNNNNNENSNNNDNNNNETNNNNNNNNNNKEQDRFLPIANVGRIMKKVIPPNGKISKEAKETVQECVSEFISFITGEASDKCQREKRKTINGDDIIWAITTLGFEDYVNPLKVYLNKFRELEGEKLNVPKQQQRSAEQLHHIPHHHHHHQRLLSHHHHHHHDQFQYIDQGLSSHFGTKTSVYSSNNNTNTLLFPNQPSFSSQEQSFSLPFSQTSMQKNYQHHQEQIDSVGHW